MTTYYDPLPKGFEPKIGQDLWMISENRRFTVLCSCPGSKPIHYTRRYIAQNLHLYGIPREAKDGNP